MWRQDAGEAAESPARLSRRALRRALEALVCQHLSVSRGAEDGAVSWNTAENAVLTEGQRVLIADPARFDGVAVIGVDEHVWRHPRRGDKYVTVIIDLTLARDVSSPAWLRDMVAGRCKKGRTMMTALIATLSTGTRGAPQELITLGYRGVDRLARAEPIYREKAAI